MVHKCLQGHIVGEDGLCSLSPNATVRSRRMRGRGVQFGQQETSLRTARVTDDETGKGKPVGNQILQVVSISARVLSTMRFVRLTLASSFGFSNSVAKFS